MRLKRNYYSFLLLSVQTFLRSVNEHIIIRKNVIIPIYNRSVETFATTVLIPTMSVSERCGLSWRKVSSTEVEFSTIHTTRLTWESGEIALRLYSVSHVLCVSVLVRPCVPEIFLERAWETEYKRRTISASTDVRRDVEWVASVYILLQLILTLQHDRPSLHASAVQSQYKYTIYFLCNTLLGAAVA